MLFNLGVLCLDLLYSGGIKKLKPLEINKSKPLEIKEPVKPFSELQTGEQVSQKAISVSLLNSDDDTSELLSGSTAGQGPPVR